MTLVESREYGQNELLITHYYQNPLFKLKDAFLKACGKLDIDVLSIDDTFNDYLIAIKGVEVLMKFEFYDGYSFLDFSFEGSFFERRRILKKFSKNNDELKKELNFVGLGLQNKN